MFPLELYRIRGLWSPGSQQELRWTFRGNWNRKGGSKKEKRGLEKDDPIGRGALRVCVRALGLGCQCWWPAMALVPQSLPFILMQPQHCWPWSRGTDGMLVDQAPSSCRLGPWAEPGWRQSWVSQEQDGSGWQRESLHMVGVWKKRENQPSLLFALSARFGPAAWVSGQPREGSHQRLCSQRSFQHPAGCLIHDDDRQPLLTLREPRGFFLGPAWTIFEHSADSEVSCFSEGSATLGSEREEADRGRGWASKVAKGIPEEVTSSNWHCALLWGSMQPPAK